MSRRSLYSIVSFCVMLFCVVSAGFSRAQTKKTINTAADVPRFRYPLSEPASTLLTSDDATFNVLTRKVESDVNSVLSDYTIADKETQRELLGTRLAVQLLNGDMKGALATVQQVRDLQDKPAAKLTYGLMTTAMVKAYEDSGATTGPAYEQAFQKHFAEEINALPWATSQNTVKEMRTSFELLSPDLLVGSAKSNLDPQVAKTGGLDLPGAQDLLGMRVAEKLDLPLTKSTLAVLAPYIAKHTVKKPDIWAARDVTLTPEDKLTPVRIAIFDSGIDTSLYPGLLFVDPHPDGHSPHGLAFDTQGKLYDGDLQPLTAEQKATYPKVITLFQGLDDLQSGIDSPAAAEVRKTLSHMPPDQLAPFLKQIRFFSQYMHGTHVAGIAVRGNPAARLVVAQFDDALPDMPFTPSVAWAEKFKADFRQVGEYFRKNNVRVVNMSWADSQGEIEQWLDKTSTEKDPNKRKQLAGQIYAVWRDAVAGAIEAAPNTLWVCAAGNSNSNASFLGDVPASLHLPNLVTVGAVDQAGDETSFTSYGDTVILDADGYEVESYVPGGTRLKESGTSMASPNVANLAGKLIALDPKLTPEQTIALMKQGATPSADGRMHLINPRASVALLKEQQKSE
ncbi:MAG TPA: S8 family serine peptidase [Acidobacteriaceae bacterium]|nr:S8 family serine peptidase [Acidobacteriaceae bacterium]